MNSQQLKNFNTNQSAIELIPQDILQVRSELPRPLVLFILSICILPFLFNLAGIDFRSSSLVFDLEAAAALAPGDLADALHTALEGSYTHTILEWSAFCAAIFTVILAFAHFNIKNDVTTPVIGVALLCAGCMDAFHTLAADRLIDAVASNQNLIPFTWALCRLCNALLTMIGVSLFLVGNLPKEWRGSTAFVTLVSSCFGVMAYGIIHICATRENLPGTMFPDALITRPWDVIPLILFVIAGIWIYPEFHRRNPSLFSHALVISTIPNVATQAHMAFGSTALFDNHFNIAHFLKIIAYLVPLAGLILDYIRTHQALEKRNEEFLAEIVERQKVEEELNTAIAELKTTQMQLIQTEKMSGLGQLVAGVAHEINNPVNFIYGNIQPADEYVKDLLSVLHLYRNQYTNPPPEIIEEIERVDLAFIEEDLPKLLASIQIGAQRIRQIVLSLRTFSRLDEVDVKQADIHEGIDSTLVILGHRLKATLARPEIQVVKSYDQIPLIECYPGQLNQVFMNILSNAVDAIEARYQPSFKEGNEFVGTIQITTAIARPGWVSIRIEDNGSGMSEAVRKRIFDPFFTTKPVGQGTGMGMSISYQIVAKNHGGYLSCESQEGVGTAFTLELPLSARSR